jgi:riboflavin kinase/FMN adenylyltransferase
LDERIKHMGMEGIERVFVLPFDSEFARLTPQVFAHGILAEGIRAAGVFVGENFRFGAKHAGDVVLLQHLGDDLGFCVEVVPSLHVRGRMVSSTEIRKLVQGGDVSVACRLLERPYSVEGTIVSGEGIGSKQTVPTLNLQTAAEILPADGVYITRTTDSDDARVWQSITNIGMRPTFGGQHRTVETFLLSAFDGRTPQRIRLEFLRRVRAERRFESPDALKSQILSDVRVATKYFRRTVIKLSFTE